MKATKQRLFIDFEASSLEPQSYPIEVAFSDPNGGKPISYLINPYLIEEWTDWDPYAQNKIHGISRKMLREEGKSPLYVAREMNRLLGGYELYCDGGDYDRFWCDRLFNAVWLDRQFRIRDSQELFHKAIRLERSLTEALLDVPSSVASKNRIIARLAGKAKSITPGKRHRAAVDVEYLENLYRLVKEWPAGEHKKAEFSGHKGERCFIDFQASGLSVSKGYPIQVAWSLPIGAVESWFIRPDNNWDADEGWDAETEAQHGFSRTFIHEDGCDTKWLCRRMNEQLAGQTLYTDDVPHDIR
ncbi:MAG: hypothetical protein GY934_07720, partial [Gammaproteobacteria bacterium]|nr:hypothetical protein [Gammaproteobacteria bacterium]